MKKRPKITYLHNEHGMHWAKTLTAKQKREAMKMIKSLGMLDKEGNIIWPWKKES